MSQKRRLRATLQQLPCAEPQLRQRRGRHQLHNEHFFLPEAQQFGSGGLAPAEDAAAATVSYFPFDRVEVEEVGLGPGAWYQGTTYYALEDQLPCLDTLATDLCSLDLSTASSVPEADTSQARGKVEDIEKDEELNNIVIAIIDD